MKFLNYLALATSLMIAGIAAYFSVIGMGIIFAGAYMSTVVMMTALEFGKIVTAAYVHLFWDKLNYMKYYLSFSVFVLMLITSLGIFGFLSKANIDQTLQGDSYSLEMSIIDKRLESKENQAPGFGEKAHIFLCAVKALSWKSICISLFEIFLAYVANL